MQKHVYGLMLVISLHQNGFAMGNGRYSNEVSLFDIRAVPFLQEVLKDRNLLERVGALAHKDDKTAVHQVQNDIYRILGEFALNRGATRVDNNDTLGIAQLERELVRLRLLKEQRALYCAVHNITNNQNPESFMILSNSKMVTAMDEIYTHLAHYTRQLMVKYVGDAYGK